MSWAQRINSKIYVLGTVINLGFAWYFSGSELDVYGWLALLIVTIALSHFFNIRGMNRLIDQRVERKQSLGGSQMLGYFALKLVLLIIGLVCLMVFIPSKVPQGLILYIFQLIILALSIKNIGKYFKKGSTS
ncbi:MAG: hypothetical protein WCY48_05550 [Candidatus Caldatribacteriota bacterium]